MKRAVRFLLVSAVVAASMIAMPAEAWAQRRVIRRPAPRTVVYVARPYYSPVYYRPYHSGAFAFGGFPGWYSWYGHPWWYAHYPYPYGRGYRGYISEARLQVQPRQAEVFIDGYFVGLVDDFDGWSQRLRVEPGEHELEIYLRGYRTYRQSVLFRPGATVRIQHVLQPLAAGEAEDPRPAPSGGARSSISPSSAPPHDRRTDGASDGPYPAGEPVPSPRAQAAVQADRYGSLAVRVQPTDAEVVVNGEPWQSPEAGSITLQLSEGTHRVEVRRSGYRTYSAEVRVRGGESTSLNVSLSRD